MAGKETLSLQEMRVPVEHPTELGNPGTWKITSTVTNLSEHAPYCNALSMSGVILGCHIADPRCQPIPLDVSLLTHRGYSD